jgi:DNA mismatch repair protein MutS2
VLVAHLGKEGEIISTDPRAGMVSVRLGTTMRTRVAVEQVRRTARAPTRPDRAVHNGAKSPRAETTAPAEVRSDHNTLDLRGLRADEAADETEKFLDKMFGSDQASAFLIHGHGTGALRSAVREYLRSSPYCRHFRPGTPEEGGDGITVVRLK